MRDFVSRKKKLIPLDHRAELGCLPCFTSIFWGREEFTRWTLFWSYVDQMKEIPKCSRIHDVFEYVFGGFPKCLNNNRIGEFHRQLSVKIRHIMSFRPGTRCINFKLSCHIVDGRNPVPVGVGSLSHYFTGFDTPSQVVVWDFWTINSMYSPSFLSGSKSLVTWRIEILVGQWQDSYKVPDENPSRTG